jgi:hypothetical protein
MHRYLQSETSIPVQVRKNPTHEPKSQLLQRIIEECFTIPWQDDMAGWDMQPDGNYLASKTEDAIKL